jgi:hypothetical protein
MPVCPLSLQRKFEQKLDDRKTIQLSPEELDLFVECGAYDAILRAAVDFRKAQIRERQSADSNRLDAPEP